MRNFKKIIFVSLMFVVVASAQAQIQPAPSRLEQKEFFISQPDALQAISDNVPLFYVDPLNYPNGIKIKSVHVATSQNVSAVYNVENWQNPQGSIVLTIVTLNLNAQNELTAQTITSPNVAAGQYVMLDLDTTAVNWLHVTIIFQ